MQKTYDRRFFSQFKKNFKRILIGLLIFFLIAVLYFFVGTPPQAEKITWGVNFSQKHTQDLGLNWQDTYLALLDELNVKNLKLLTHWDLIEPEKDRYNFENLDWQISEAQKRGVKILLVIGMKTGRWPECHAPKWAQCQMSNVKCQNFQKEELLEYLKTIVNQYKNSKTIWAWQVENEPFFPFGECPKIDKKFVRQEIQLVKSLDPKRPVIFTDSGEFSFWLRAAELGDMVGITLHRKVWFKEIKTYFTFPLTPTYYWRKAQIIKKIYNKKVICVELQAEPWCPTLLYDCSLEEQQKTMNLERWRRNLEFAQKTGFDTIYLWGGEWWYWLKEKQNQPAIWQEAKELWKN